MYNLKKGFMSCDNWKKNVIVFLASQNISLIGSILVQYAISWYIVLQTQSGLMVSISILCGFLPTFLVSPFAGVWADRFNKKMIIVIADSAIALSTLLLAVIFMLGLGEIWLLFIVSIIWSLGGGVQTPTINALIPHIIPSDKLMKINGANNSLQSIVSLVSPMHSGVLLSVSTIEYILFIDVFTALVAVTLLICFVKTDFEKSEEKQKVRYFHDLIEGIKYILSHKFIRIFFIYSALFFLLSSPLMFLTPLQVARSFGEEVWRLTTIEVAFSLGMILGGVLITLWGGFKRKMHTAVMASFFVAASTLALGIVPSFWLYSGIMVVIGVAIPVFSTPIMVLLQKNIEPTYMGRVFGVLSMLTSLITPLSMLGYGPLADYVKIEWILIVTGVLLIAFCFAMVGNKTIMTFEKKGQESPLNDSLT